MAWVDTRFVSSSSSTDGKTGHRNDTLVWEVEYNELTHTAREAKTATGIPGRMTILPGDPRSRCINIDATQKETWDGGMSFTVTADYSTDVRQQYENPLDEPPQYSKQFQEFQKDIEVDPVSGDPIVNKAGDAFLTACQVDDAREIHVITRNEPYSAYDPSADLEYKNKTNEGEWNGQSSGKWLCKPIIRQYATAIVADNLLEYWVTTYRFHLDEDGHKYKPLNQGFRYKEDGEQKQILVEDEDGNKVPIQTPRMLDNEGAVLPIGEEPITLEFNKYKRKSFAALDITFPGGE